MLITEGGSLMPIDTKVATDSSLVPAYSPATASFCKAKHKIFNLIFTSKNG